MSGTPERKEPDEDQKIVIDVQEESYYKGYEAAYTECKTPYTPTIWDKVRQHESNIILAALIVFLIMVLVMSRKQRKKYWEMNQQIVERQKTMLEIAQKSEATQEKALEEMLKTNALLQQLLDQGKR